MADRKLEAGLSLSTASTQPQGLPPWCSAPGLTPTPVGAVPGPPCLSPLGLLLAQPRASLVQLQEPGTGAPAQS